MNFNVKNKKITNSWIKITNYLKGSIGPTFYKSNIFPDVLEIEKVLYEYQKLNDRKWLYRLESKTKDNGLWYDSNNNYVWGCKDCTGEAKNLPMDYDERYHVQGKNWFSSCSSKEDLLHWYSLEDANYLINHGFVFTRYLALEYIEYDTKETVFLKESCLAREEIDINDLFKESK